MREQYVAYISLATVSQKSTIDHDERKLLFSRLHNETVSTGEFHSIVILIHFNCANKEAVPFQHFKVQIKCVDEICCLC